MSSPKERYYTRTMHTPDDPARAELRSRLRDLSKALLPMHRALIQSAKADYALANAPVTPTQLLQLLNDDPFFSWLKPVTALIVDIDETVRTDFEETEARALAGRAERLFGGSPDAEFAERYRPALQHDTDVAMNLAAVRKALSALTPRQ